MTRGELVTELAAMLGARHEARFIVEDVLGPAAASASAAPVAAPDLDRARQLAARRQAGEPLQYVLGHWSFRSLDLLVDPRVLIPRPETEQVVEVALGELALLSPAAPVLVDLGTGSGAIALSLASELSAIFPNAQVFAVESSPDALIVAQANRERTMLTGAAVLPLTLLEGSWLEPLPHDLRGGVDLVISNPPYVALHEWDGLDPEVRTEPRQALIAGASSEGTPGLADVEAVLRQSRQWLARPGAVVIELAPHQAEAAVTLAKVLGYGDVRVEPDLSGRARTLVARP